MQDAFSLQLLSMMCTKH